MPRWEYTNPESRPVALGDCVARSCSIAFGIEYWKVWKNLYGLSKIERLRGNQKRSDPDKMVTARVIAAYMQLNDWYWFNGPFTWDQLPQNEVVVVSLHNHLTVLDNGVVKDTWDSTRRRKILGFYKRG